MNEKGVGGKINNEWVRTLIIREQMSGQYS